MDQALRGEDYVNHIPYLSNIDEKGRTSRPADFKLETNVTPAM